MYSSNRLARARSDADITIINPKKEDVIRSEGLYTKNQLTMFDGVKIKGMPIASFVRGILVMQEGQVIGQPGYGRMIQPRT